MEASVWVSDYFNRIGETDPAFLSYPSTFISPRTLLFRPMERYLQNRIGVYRQRIPVLIMQKVRLDRELNAIACLKFYVPSKCQSSHLCIESKNAAGTYGYLDTPVTPPLQSLPPKRS
jgi:hypothetical protein